MNNKKIPTSTGAIVLIIIALTVFGVVWGWEKNQEVIEQSQVAVNIKKPAATQENQQNQVANQNTSQGVEFPTISTQPGMRLEDIIKQAIYKKSPDWKNRNYDIVVTVETSKENYAIGRFVYDGYNVTRDGSHHNTGEEIWFAAKSDESWTLTGVSGAGYWGSCQNFKKYNFPLDMTPDCWDTDKNILIETSNPKRFYPDGFTKTDKKELIQAFISFIKEQKKSGKWEPDSYLQKDLYVKVDKKVGNYIYGAMLISGSQNISTPYFLAVKKNSEWIVVHNGQDIPNCSAICPYKFPHEIIGTCYDDVSKTEKKNL
ncbi:MAG: hypothetical protein WA064_02350 [Candidatus Moraniibacteriota bacterium]